jgi:hypothetical protein
VRQKILPIILPPRYQAELERQARQSERDAVQQARWLLKRALGSEAPADRSSDDLAALGRQA